MPSGANHATINKVVKSYQSLMQSKMDMLSKQEQSAINASQKKSVGGGGGGSVTLADILKKYPPKK
jgi:hypothetical protein